jgi:hypothetical protein
VPARSSAQEKSVPLDHPFDCPTGDGGRCTLPQPPVVVGRGGLRAVSDPEELRARSVDPDDITLLNGMGVEAMRGLIDDSTQNPAGYDGRALVMTCSCGHVLVARTKEP